MLLVDIFNNMVKLMNKIAVTKEKKKQIKGKKLKKMKYKKKLGLAKYVHSDIKPKKNQPDYDGNINDSVNVEKRKANFGKDKISLKSDIKNLSLIERCKLQMSSSILRLVDEDIYTSDTKHIPIDKEKFVVYHEAYASVSDKWPIKPIDYIIKFIKKHFLSKKKPLHKIKFADIGCGKEPLLKLKLPSKCKVKSFDLVSTHKDIIEANMEKLPIDSESIHCAVYSLSLMAKNLGNILLECKRILKLGGSLLIVEVTSRFEGNDKRFLGKLEKLGFKKKSSAALEPNGYFTFFHLTKLNSIMDYAPSSLNIELKPCIYKSR